MDMDKNLSKMMILPSHTGCYIDVHLYQRYITISQIHQVTHTNADQDEAWVMPKSERGIQSISWNTQAAKQWDSTIPPVL